MTNAGSAIIANLTVKKEKEMFILVESPRWLTNQPKSKSGISTETYMTDRSYTVKHLLEASRSSSGGVSSLSPTMQTRRSADNGWTFTLLLNWILFSILIIITLIQKRTALPISSTGTSSYKKLDEHLWKLLRMPNM
jgi:hypothetical protein